MSDKYKVPVISMKKTGQRLTELREKTGLTRKEFASKINISYSALSNWEMGNKIPSTDMLVILSAVYKIPINSLLVVDYLDGFMENFTMNRDLYNPENSIPLIINKNLEDIKEDKWTLWVFKDKEGNLIDGDVITFTSHYLFEKGKIVKIINE